MKALCWCGSESVKVESVSDPHIINERDAIVKITSTAICGSDLHLYDGYIPTMKSGDILGHEFMGEVVEIGPAVKNLKIGDRIVVPFSIGCGDCFYCKRGEWSLCNNSNPNAWMLADLYGYAGAGIFGYSHLYGGYAGGQAEYARVPFADVCHVKIPNGLKDESVLFLSDIFPTGYHAAVMCDIKPGDVIIVFGCGPVGQMAIKSAFLLGAGRVIAIDRFGPRLNLAAQSGAEVVDYSKVDSLLATLTRMTGGSGGDACIDAVGLEAAGHTLDAVYDYAKQAMRLETDRTHALREAIMACRKGGIVSIVGVYGGFVDKFPLGAAFGKGLTFKMGQCPVQKYMRPLLEHIERGDIDPSFVITHKLPLSQAPEAYKMFRDKTDECIKVVLKPDHQSVGA